MGQATDAGPAFDSTRPIIAYEHLKRGQKAIVVTFVIMAIVYLGWRAGTLNPDAKLFSIVLYGAELFGFATALLHIFMVWKLTIRHAPPPPPGLSVDIFIPTYNEPVALVRRTILAARNVDYPHGTWLLDDGNRPEMAAMAAELGVRYLARTENLHAKAGNLNHALKHSTADFVAIFDADHAPKRNFLDETLGFFDDPTVAFVQTPQDFFNLDSYQHRTNARGGPVWTEQSLFFRVIQRGKDVWNAAFFCGSCAIVRRSALDRIGGIATGTITEDLETSVELHKAGYRSVYVEQALAFGIAPASVIPFLTQRIRWGQGAMQVIRKEWFFLRGRLSVAQRLNYMASTLTYFEGWTKAIYYLAPVIVLLTGTMPIVATAREFLPLFIPYFVLTLVVFEEAGRGFGRSMMIEQYNMARFAAFMWATLGLLRRNLRFRVTSKEHLSAAAAEMRMVSPQMMIAAFNVAAVIVGTVLFLYYRHLPDDGFIANVVWAMANFALAALVVRFTRMRTRYQRREYRFPVALPARINFQGVRSTVTVDDVSSSGCRIYGRFPADIGVGALVVGTLMLPGDSLEFRARVASLIPGKSRGERYVKALGLAFDWHDQQDRDRLDLFLYGSDLQWHLHHVGERVETPTEILGRWHRGEPAPTRRSGVWSAADLDNGRDEMELVLVSRPSSTTAHRLVASSQRILGLDQVGIREYTRQGNTIVQLRPLREVARVSTPTGSLYLTESQSC